MFCKSEHGWENALVEQGSFVSISMGIHVIASVWISILHSCMCSTVNVVDSEW